ncbi:hypothetical protein [Paenibacillus sp.]|uniref:hypothetical protein n=1 Tax=Paenibacillus sp. TaxID=58172 RepID=UPI0028A71D3F|nr:hypothetical protein [Paenibacillus sp.]
MLLKWRGLSILALLLMIILISGCSNGTVHVTVNKNQSVDLAMNVKLDSRTEALISDKMEKSLTDKLKDEGIQLEKRQEGKSTVYQIQKNYTSFGDISSTSMGLDIVNLQLNTKENWLYTRYDVEAQPKFNSYMDTIMDNMGTLSLSKPIIQAVLKNLAFDFKLTLPIDLFGENNATVEEGRTLTWNVTLGDTEPIKMQVYVPNVWNIVIVLIILVVVIITTIILFIRKRKHRNVKRT